MRLRPRRMADVHRGTDAAVTAHAFTVWNEGYNVFLFGPSDSRLNISCHSVGVVCEDTAERVVRRSSSAPFGVNRADFDNRT